jgi:hypothetical protein
MNGEVGFRWANPGVVAACEYALARGLRVEGVRAGLRYEQVDLIEVRHHIPSGHGRIVVSGQRDSEVVLALTMAGFVEWKEIFEDSWSTRATYTYAVAVPWMTP